MTLAMVLGMFPAVGIADEVEVESDDDVVVNAQDEDNEDVDVGLMPGMGLMAYAEDSSYEFTTSDGVRTYTNDIITVTAGFCDGDGIDLSNDRDPVQITAVDGCMITKIEMVCWLVRGAPSADEITATNGTVTTQGTISEGTTVTIDNINANSTSISRNKMGWLQFNQFKIYYGIAHTHSFTYAASGATITATCGGTGTCDITEGLTLTISAPTGELTADGTKQFPATLSTGYNTTAFPGSYIITYTKDGLPFDGTPSDAGAYAASVTVGDATASVSYTIAEPEPAVPTATVTAHVQKKGWLSAVSSGAVAGTTGKSRRLEALTLTVPDADVEGGIEYRSHVQKTGWEKSWKRDGKRSGTTGKARRLEAVQIRLYGEMAKKYDVYYRVHSQRYGWMAWAKNGQRAGTQGKSRRGEALQVVIVVKGAEAPGATYQGATQTYGKAFVRK